jgi:hypothetical protein
MSWIYQKDSIPLHYQIKDGWDIASVRESVLQPTRYFINLSRE